MCLEAFVAVSALTEHVVFAASSAVSDFRQELVVESAIDVIAFFVQEVADAEESLFSDLIFCD